ncbi:MAG: hypothetical protein K2L45_03535 [Muribaculaceae bacterium]|nr:hypothetical protein [Muribaculaceae bacterium]MDE6631578.1 hypothetical protein [Muribaculaceae bacterium]
MKNANAGTTAKQISIPIINHRMSTKQPTAINMIPIRSTIQIVQPEDGVLIKVLKIVSRPTVKGWEACMTRRERAGYSE